LKTAQANIKPDLECPSWKLKKFS